MDENEFFKVFTEVIYRSTYTYTVKLFRHFILKLIH